MTISKQCELLAGDYLFLRDKLMGVTRRNVAKGSHLRVPEEVNHDR